VFFSAVSKKTGGRILCQHWADIFRCYYQKIVFVLKKN